MKRLRALVAAVLLVALPALATIPWIELQTGWAEIQLGAGATPTSIIGPTGGGQLAPVTGRGVIVLLGVSTVALGSNGTTNVFLTPGSGFTRMVVTHLILDGFSGGVTFTTNTMSFGTSAGVDIDWLPVTPLSGTVTTGSAMFFTPPNGTPRATWLPNNQVQLVVAGSGVAVNTSVEVWGFYE